MNKQKTYGIIGYANPHIVSHSEADEVLWNVPLTSGGVVLNSSLPTRTFNEHNTSFIITNNYLVQGRKKDNETKRMERINRT